MEDDATGRCVPQLILALVVYMYTHLLISLTAVAQPKCNRNTGDWHFPQVIYGSIHVLAEPNT